MKIFDGTDINMRCWCIELLILFSFFFFFFSLVVDLINRVHEAYVTFRVCTY